MIYSANTYGSAKANVISLDSVIKLKTNSRRSNLRPKDIRKNKTHILQPTLISQQVLFPLIIKCFLSCHARPPRSSGTSSMASIHDSTTLLNVNGVFSDFQAHVADCRPRMPLHPPSSLALTARNSREYLTLPGPMSLFARLTGICRCFDKLLAPAVAAVRD